MTRLHPWEISDELWAIVEPLIPTSDEIRDKTQTYKRKTGADRKRKYSDRLFFAAIVYVLRTGIIWNAIPREKFGGIGSSVLHKRFQLWTEEGFFDRVWQAGLDKYDELKGIEWEWQSQSADNCQIQTPLAQESVELNPADREKKGEQSERTDQGQWRPVIAHRHRSQQT